MTDKYPVDKAWMRRALELAARGEGFVEPNPMVGCVIVRDGQKVGEGFHGRYGGPHAEIEALRSLESKELARDATAYVTLEPCCHVGKTPPCSQALIDAGVKRVVAAVRDPFPKVDGGGIRHLRSAGIECETGLLEAEAKQLLAPYLKKVTRGLPWVIAKWAMTLDGKIATVAGESQWISGELSRRHVHRLRGRVDAIIAGSGTIVADDPMLNARLPEEDRSRLARTATRVVLCRRTIPSLRSRVFQTASEIPTLVYASGEADPDALQKIAALGAEILTIETKSDDESTELVDECLRDLGNRGMTNVMLEGGPGILASFLSSSHQGMPGAIDEWHAYIGAKVFAGPAPGPIAGNGIANLVDAPSLQLRSVDRFEDDVRLVYRRC
ncbi:MAG: bifunctional diaminohydroxyphosphoribosylaminopyrimidine deaminase/5-amino-6-(5-phosphoribosylamino)uracil reductase RibD [Planctomycetota bacterium]